MDVTGSGVPPTGIRRLCEQRSSVEIQKQHLQPKTSLLNTGKCATRSATDAKSEVMIIHSVGLQLQLEKAQYPVFSQLNAGDELFSIVG